MLTVHQAIQLPSAHGVWTGGPSSTWNRRQMPEHAPQPWGPSATFLFSFITPASQPLTPQSCYFYLFNASQNPLFYSQPCPPDQGTHAPAKTGLPQWPGPQPFLSLNFDQKVSSNGATDAGLKPSRGFSHDSQMTRDTPRASCSYAALTSDYSQFFRHVTGFSLVTRDHWDIALCVFPPSCHFLLVTCELCWHSTPVQI